MADLDADVAGDAQGSEHSFQGASVRHSQTKPRVSETEWSDGEPACMPVSLSRHPKEEHFELGPFHPSVTLATFSGLA